MWTRFALVLVVSSGCYTSAPANRDVQASWRGRGKAEIIDRWGEPRAREPNPNGELAVWSYTTRHIELPDASLETRPVTTTAHIDGGVVQGDVSIHASQLSASFRPGVIWNIRNDAAASIDGSGTIDEVQGPALHWGPPNDVNIHWGTILGAHVGLGRLDTTGTPLPSGGAFIGGMVSPTLGLVGTFALATGTSDRGAAMGLAGGFAAQWWPITRMWLRAGPALVLALDPGFNNARLRPGGTAGVSYAFVKVGRLAVDLRIDVVAAPSTAFGTFGVGVNLL
jgi:hypothetical protein